MEICHDEKQTDELSHVITDVIDTETSVGCLGMFSIMVRNGLAGPGVVARRQCS